MDAIFSPGPHLFWIAGLAVALAALAAAAVQALREGEKLRVRLRRRNYQAVLMAAAGLFCIGLGLTAENTWERVLWLGLAVLFGTQIAAALWAPERDEGDGKKK
jgi:uncharacterized membrane protein